MKPYLLSSTIFFTALSAGLFYSWSVSVIPGTKRVSDSVYIETMQAINKAILNPWFLIIFIGPIILLFINCFEYYHHKQVFYVVLIASIFYTLGTVGVTAFGNVPLNNALDAISTNKLSLKELIEIRHEYEVKWNQFHFIRTIFSVTSFALLLLAINLANSTSH